MGKILGTWIAAFLTLAIFSFLYRDNEFYKFAEHLFVGISGGYLIAIQWHTVIIPNLFFPLFKKNNFLVLIPTILGFFLFTRFFRRWSWLSLLPIAFVMGVFSGAAIPAHMQASILAQIQDTIKPFHNLSELLVLIGVLCTLSYFFFSQPHKGCLGILAKV